MEDVIARLGPRRALLLAWAAVFAWASAIFWLSSHTGAELPRHWLLAHDKLCHAAEYALLGLLLCHALSRSELRPARALLGASLLSLLYGASDEYHQGFVAGRQGNDPFDVAADVIGGTLGALTFTLVAASWQRKSSLPPASPSRRPHEEIPA